LDDFALAQAEGYLESGTSLDTICRLLNRRYRDWIPPQQEVYRAYVNGAVELRKAQNPQFSDNSASLTCTARVASIRSDSYTRRRAAGGPGTRHPKILAYTFPPRRFGNHRRNSSWRTDHNSAALTNTQSLEWGARHRCSFGFPRFSV
jgi:hypothetical protein